MAPACTHCGDGQPAPWLCCPAHHASKPGACHHGFDLSLFCTHVPPLDTGGVGSGRGVGTTGCGSGRGIGSGVGTGSGSGSASGSTSGAGVAGQFWCSHLQPAKLWVEPSLHWHLMKRGVPQHWLMATCRGRLFRQWRTAAGR